MTNKPIVHIIDDDDAVRDSIAFLVESAGFSARTYDSADALVTALPILTSGCLVTDVRMPGMNGLDLVRHLKTINCPLPVIMITGHGDVPLAVEAMKEGVFDFIEKPFEDDILLSAITSALDQAEGKADESAKRQAILARIQALSGREQDVLKGLVAGKANKVIAFDLGISPRTVEIYRANVMTKMQADSLSELVRMALSVGL